MKKVRHIQVSLFFCFLFSPGCTYDVEEADASDSIGNLPHDFFLVGEYSCYKFQDTDGVIHLYGNSDSLELSISNVSQGRSLMNWFRHDTLLSTANISTYRMSDSFNAYLWPYPDVTLCYLYEVGNILYTTLYCFPNFIEYGYTSDSLQCSGIAFGEEGIYYMRKTP